MNEIDISSPMPRYFQLKEILLRYIENEGLRVNDKLPSIRNLISKYSVSLPVVTRALKELEKDDIIVIKKVKGSFVKNLPTRLVANARILFLLYGCDFSDPYYSKMLTGVEQETAGKSFSVLYKHVESGRNLANVINQGVSGIVVAGKMDLKKLNEVKALKVPFVLAGDLYQREVAPGSITTIVNDDRHGAYMAVKYLLELGHRRIGLISGLRHIHVWKNRYQGYRDAMEEYALPLKENDMVEAGEEKEIRSGYEGMKKLMLQNNPPTAVFTGNDWYAMGVYFFLSESGMKAGRDISVVGFDNLEFAATLMPPLTTVSAKMEEIGKRAVKALLEQINTQDTEHRREIILVKLIERESCQKWENN